jgi:hypothetical protein
MIAATYRTIIANPLRLRSPLGAEHPDTLISRINLAVACKSAGDPDQAIPLYEPALGLRAGCWAPTRGAGKKRVTSPRRA